MGQITVKLPDDVEDNFRKTISAKHDHIIKKGDIQDGFLEAINEWIEKNKPQEK